MRSITFYLFSLSILLMGCTEKTAKNTKNIVDADTTVICSSESVLAGFYNLGTTAQMKVIQGHYTPDSKLIFAVVLNPQHFRLSYGYDWTLEKWEKNKWIRPKMKVTEFVYSDELIGPISDFLCLQFPIEHYEIAPGRYRILTSVDNDREEIKLSAEFEIK